MDDLSPIEAAILAQIARDPFVGQHEMAGRLDIARSTVAAHVAALTRKGHILGRGYVLPAARRVVCLGGAVLDRRFRAARPLVRGASNPATAVHAHGGVARTVAETLALLGHETGLVSAVGDDETGRAILSHLRARGVDVSQVRVSGRHATAEYCAILSPDGALDTGIADMDIFGELTPDRLDRARSHLVGATLVFCDGNPPAETLDALIANRRDARHMLAIDPASPHKAGRLPADLSGLDVLFVTVDEANACLSAGHPATPDGAAAAAASLRDRGAGAVVLAVGDGGLCVAGAEGTTHLPALPDRAAGTPGPGTAITAGTLHALLGGAPLTEAARTGMHLAGLTAAADAPVRADLSPSLLDRHRPRDGAPLPLTGDPVP